MLFKVTTASGIPHEEAIEKEINTLEELKEFVDSYKFKFNGGHGCVIYWDTMELIIYDNYIE